MTFPQATLTKDKFLNGKLQLWQPRSGYRAATDPVLLAAACPARAGETVLDLGCGIGTAGLCVAARVDVELTGLEVQEDYAELARRNAAENEISITIVQGDLAQMPTTLKDKTFDHVIMNPPFFGPGTKATDAGRALSRQEQVRLSTWLDSGLRRLHPKGWLTLIQTIERLPDVIVALNNRAGGLQIKPLSPRRHKPATRFVIRARKGSKAKALLANPLILHEGDAHTADMDSYTEEAKAILRDGSTLEF